MQESEENKQQDEASGIVIRTFESGESDLVLRVLTDEFGKLSLFARGARRSVKRFPGRPDVFDDGVFTVKIRDIATRDLPATTGFSARSSFQAIRTDRRRFSVGIYLAELCDNVSATANREDSPLATHFREALTELSATSTPQELLRISYKSTLTILASVGFGEDHHSRPPSTGAFVALLEKVEIHTGKGLLTRPALYALMKEYATTQVRESEE